MAKWDLNLNSPLTVEDLEKLQAAWEDVTRVFREHHPGMPVYKQHCERSKGYIHSIGCLFFGSIGTGKEADIICEVLNNLPQLIEATKAQLQQPPTHSAPQWDGSIG